MVTVGVTAMMLREQAASDGMFAVLERLAGLGVHCVEMSQIPMDAATTAALERGVRELGTDVAALSIALRSGPDARMDALDTDYAKIIDDCGRLGCRFLRVPMLPIPAMASRDACAAWAAECEEAAQRLAADGVTLLYHNHHIDLAQFDGERIFDLVRRVAPSVRFEVDLHWVQRGGMAPLDMLAAYRGVCRTIHVKDYRVVPLSTEAVDAALAGHTGEFWSAFTNLVQFAEVGQGNMNWPAILPAALDAGAEYFLIEQDDTYGRDPYDCIADSRRYLASLGY